MSFPKLILLCVAGLVFGHPIDIHAEVAPTKVREAYGKLPLSFELNQGQADQRANFVARGNGYSLFLTPTEAVFAFRNAGARSERNDIPVASKQPGKNKRWLRLKLVGANSKPAAQGLDELDGKVNYLLGPDPADWRTDLPTFRRVRYQGVYPGIDLVYYGNENQLEYDFVLAPGGDWRQVALQFVGADSVKLDKETGDLVVRLGEQTVRQHKPIIYQEGPEGRREIEGRYVLRRGGRIGFELGKYDATLPVVIDPVLVYSTTLGGSNLEIPGGIAVDLAGNVYLTGETDSADFPLKDPLQTTHRTPFVTKINAEGNALVYSTYFGIGSVDAEDIAVDSMGSVYLTGETRSAGIPIVNAIQSSHGGGELDAFVTKINPAGNAVVYSTYLGGAGEEEGNAIAVDAADNAYVVGFTDSVNFPTANPLQAANGGFIDVFVAKINPAGAFVYSTYLGGIGGDFGNGIAADSAGNAHISGTTFGTFPTVNALQPTNAGDDDAFVAKINAAGNSLLYSTHLGGSGRDAGGTVAVDSSGDTYVTGKTRSADFPITPNAFGKVFGGDDVEDAFVTRINAAATALVYSTYLGGVDSDEGADIAVDPNGNAYVTGTTDSDDFPLVNPLQTTTDGEQIYDAFIVKINPAGDALVYSTYFGGDFDDFGSSIAVDSGGNAYVMGLTGSVNFPTLNALQNWGGDYEVFVMKISGAPGGPVVEKKLVNVSTRLSVGTGENVGIGGFIVTGSGDKKVAVRAIGPSLSRSSITNFLTDPVLEIYRGDTLIATNDNWRDTQETEIQASYIAPTEEAESMVITRLDPGGYTAIVRGKNGGTGVGLVEVYDLESGVIEAELANISSRGFVQTGADVMIGGFIVRGAGTPIRVVVRALGPSLLSLGVSGALADPTLELRDENGALIRANDNWRQTQQTEIEDAQLAPGHDLDSALVATVGTGHYTAIVHGKDNTVGVGLVEIYNVH